MTFRGERLPDGRLRVPMRAEGPDGMVGDAVGEIGPDHPAFATWDEYLTLVERESSPVPVQEP